MKKLIRLLIIFSTVILVGSNVVYAENEEILESQKRSLNLSDFISESQKYVDENLEGIDIQELLNSAISGKVEDKNIIRRIFKVFGGEVKQAIELIRKYTSNSINSQCIKNY